MVAAPATPAARASRDGPAEGDVEVSLKKKRALA
jgi:hypothetical protein